MIIFASVSGDHRDFLKRTKSPASSFMFKPVAVKAIVEKPTFLKFVFCKVFSSTALVFS